MKVTITYFPCEEREADVLKAFIKGLMPGMKVKESDRHTPYKHIYLATRKSSTVDGQPDS